MFLPPSLSKKKKVIEKATHEQYAKLGRCGLTQNCNRAGAAAAVAAAFNLTHCLKRGISIGPPNTRGVEGTVAGARQGHKPPTSAAFLSSLPSSSLPSSDHIHFPPRFLLLSSSPAP